MLMRRPLTAAVAMLCSANAAFAMDASTSTELPETGQVLGWYGSFLNGRDSLSDFSVCLDSSAGCFRGSTTANQAVDGGLVFEASIGYAFQNGFRLSGEVAERSDLLAQLTENDRYEQTRQFGVMLSGAYDLQTDSPLTPFIGAGVGGVRVQHGDAELFESGFDFTADSGWKLGLEGFAGLQYEFSPELRLGLRYSHKVVSDVAKGDGFKSSVDVQGSGDGSLRNRALMLTLTFEFGGKD